MARAERSYVTRTILLPVQKYIHTESIGGIVLLAATIAALVWANSPWKDQYESILSTYLTLDMGLFEVKLSLQHWINDGLMAIFFFVIGLEIKRELFFGHFSTWRGAALPAIAALGGMVVPAAIYLMFNLGDAGSRGWGIPLATDIAFALGILALLGRRIPSTLRVFLLGLAVVDDLGAILVIAVAYTETISFTHLAMVGGLAIVTIAANRLGFRHTAVTAALGFLIWVAMLKSGVHATIAGVLFGFLTSASAQYSREEFAEKSERLTAEYKHALSNGDTEHSDVLLGEMEGLAQNTESPMERLQRLVHPWSSYVILPAFALANAGLNFSGVDLGSVLTSDITIGVALGLLLGKVIGITLFPWLASKFGIVQLPQYVTWTHVLGIGLLGGVGFTVAIFISKLAFTDPQFILNAQVGIMSASLMAGLIGYLTLYWASRNWTSRTN